MKKKFISALLLCFMLISNAIAHAAPTKDETVYVSMKNDGSTASIKIVNHLYNMDNSGEFTDYGKYTEIKNLTGALKPEVTGDYVKWNLTEIKEKDLYYEGSVDKELPVKAEIRYFLDGREFKAEELSGKKGKLKIIIKVDFKEEEGISPDLMAQVQVTADLDIFRNLETQGNKVVIGKTAAVNFVALPPEDAEFVLEMDGENIYLEPITITVLPASFNVPEDISKGIDSLTKGLGDMEKASDSLAEGMQQTITGTSELKSGMSQLNVGLNSIYRGSDEIYTQSQKLSSSMNEFEKGLKEISDNSSSLISGLKSLSGGINELSQRSHDIQKGLQGVHMGTKELQGGISGLKDGSLKLKEGHDKLSQVAALYANHPDPMVAAMAKGILGEKDGIDQLNEGLTKSSKAMKDLETSTGALSSGYNDFHGGLYQISSGMNKTAEEAPQLSSALNQLTAGFSSMREGSSKLFKGFGDINKSIGTVKNETSGLPGDVGKLVDGQQQIKEGMSKLGKEGIGKARAELQNNLNNSIIGDNKNPYNSFADNSRNKNSTVQFIMRTPGISKQEEKKEAVVQVEENKNIFQRFLDLFRR
ncbi:hypothetical protein [Clostridium polynesiense]|uniref:hypothetical protein n=1 Tax=Clostridium polynesiense TaxID=1325933 RepID=UPI00058FFEB6|nr:hypothetical protein [Clostridium polynesiense]